MHSQFVNCLKKNFPPDIDANTKGPAAHSAIIV